METQTNFNLLSAPVPVQVWGSALIDQQALDQMDVAARLPVARAGAVMPDAHVGYGLPIGGVLATADAVIPYAVGVDIACRMRLSIVDLPPNLIEQKSQQLEKALLTHTCFGAGGVWRGTQRAQHAVLENPLWREHWLSKKLLSKAAEQLGTSGGGNHFVELGALALLQGDAQLGLAPGKYLALLSHSGSRGFGAQVAGHFSQLAQQNHPELPKQARHLAWLDLANSAGAEYWALMTLAGDYAAANHAVIHQRVLGAIGLKAAAVVENHHNFAWHETLLDGTAVVVHRKGATPAGKGVLGMIPGSMAEPGYLVRGLGNAAALNSAAHGAGRQLSRSQATQQITVARMRKYLQERDIKLLGGAVDEAPQAYKNITDVLAAQHELVEVLARFQPRIVRMADRGGGE